MLVVSVRSVPAQTGFDDGVTVTPVIPTSEVTVTARSVFTGLPQVAVAVARTEKLDVPAELRTPVFASIDAPEPPTME